MRICLLFHFCLWLAAAGASDAATRLQVSECIGSHGERVFSDADCGADHVREWSLALPPSAPRIPEPVAERPANRRQSRSRRPAQAADRGDSYQCTAGGQSWYQHSPCRGKVEQGEPVRELSVPSRRVPFSPRQLRGRAFLYPGSLAGEDSAANDVLRGVCRNSSRGLSSGPVPAPFAPQP